MAKIDKICFVNTKIRYIFASRNKTKNNYKKAKQNGKFTSTTTLNAKNW